MPDTSRAHLELEADEAHGGIASTPPLALSKFTILYLCTAGLYSIFWFGRTLRVVVEQTGDSISISARTLLYTLLPASVLQLALFLRVVVYPSGWQASIGRLIHVPWLAALEFGSLFFLFVGAAQFYRLLKQDLEHLRAALGGQYLIRKPELQAFEFCILWLGWLLPNPYRYIALLSVFPLRSVQMAVNQYLSVLDLRMDEERRFSAMEMVVAVVGGAVLLWLVGGALIQFMENFQPTNAPPGA